MTKTLRSIYQELQQNLSQTNLQSNWKRHIWEGPSQSEISAWQSQGYGVYQGKIRTVLSRDGRIQMLHSDRLTAFDRLIDHVPLKGVILTAISKYWFEQASKIVPTHYIGTMGPRALITESLNPIKAEIVVRGYLAGSILRSYNAGERIFCGVKLPDGLKPYSRLPEPIITPTTKAAAFEHDENITAQELIHRKICKQHEWDTLGSMALKVFSLGTKIFSDRGWILVDTKYEFGRTQDGTIKLIDEVHTPDSSRLWESASYEERLAQNQAPIMLDKENVRRWLLEQGFSGYGEVPAVPKSILLELAMTYLDVAEKLTGEPMSI